MPWPWGKMTHVGGPWAWGEVWHGLFVGHAANRLITACPRICRRRVSCPPPPCFTFSHPVMAVVCPLCRRLELVMSNMEYRFRTIDSYGSILLTEKSVISKMHHCGSVWERETPLDRIQPYATRSTRITKLFWWCLLMGSSGLICGLWGQIDNEGTNMTRPWAFILAAGGLGLVLFAIKNRSETWTWFPSDLDGHFVSYCKSGPDATRFDSFTEQLISQIRTARDAKV